MTTPNTFLTATEGNGGILPDTYGDLVLGTLRAKSLAYRPEIATFYGSDEGHDLHLPILAKDPQAAWVAEGEEITQSVPEMDELIIHHQKVAALTAVSREMVDDSNPKAADIVGNALGNDIAKKIDAAFFGKLEAPAPQGLDATTPSIATGTLDSLDIFAEAIATAATNDGRITSFVVNAVDLLKIRQLKTADNALTPLLGINAAEAGAETIFGIPVFDSPDVTPGTGWALSAETNILAQRKEINVAISEDAFFSSDRVAIRATARAAFGFPQPKHNVKITFTDTAA